MEQKPQMEKEKKSGSTQQQTQERNTCIDDGMKSVDKIWIQLSSYASQIPTKPFFLPQDC